MDKHFTSDLLKSLVSTSSGSVVTVGFHFVSVLLMTRYVPQDVLGMYFLALAVVHFLKIASGLGLDLTLSKFVSGSDESLQQDALASTLAVRLLSTTAVSLIFYSAGQLILPVLDARLNDCIVAMVILFALTSFRELFLHLMQGARQFKAYAFVEVLSAVYKVILLTALHARLSLEGLLVIDITSQFTSFLVQLFVVRARLLTLTRKNVNSTSLRSMSRFCVPLYLNNMLAVLHDRSSTFLIGVLLTPASVAAYEVALKIPEGFVRLFSSFITVYFPTMSSLFAKGNREDAQRVMNTSLVLLSAGILFLVLVGFLFADEIVLAVFPTEYRDVSLAFALLMLNFYLRAIANVLGYSLVSAGYPSAPIKAYTVAGAVNILSSLIMIQIFGYVGAVYSLMLMNIVSQIIYGLLLRGAELAPHLLAYSKPVFLLGAALGVYWLFEMDDTLLRLLLVGFYVVGCWMLAKEIRESARSAFQHVIKARAGPKPVQ